MAVTTTLQCREESRQFPLLACCTVDGMTSWGGGECRISGNTAALEDGDGVRDKSIKFISHCTNRPRQGLQGEEILAEGTAD